MSAPTRFVDWLLPENLRCADADTRRRARMVVGFTLALVIWAPVFAVLYQALRLPEFSVSVLTAGGFAVLILGLLRGTGRIRWSANLIVLVLFVLLAYLSVFSGGISSPAVPWLLAVPMIATMTLGYRQGAAWVVATLLTLVVLYVEEGAQWSVVRQLNARQMSIWGFAASSGITIVIYSLTLIYEKLKDEALETVLAANRAKSEFLTNMSHELRTPLTAILGFAEVLQEDGGDTSAAANRNRKLQTIRRNGEHLLELINGILDLSKIEAGKMQAERLLVSPARILNDVVTLLQVRAEGRGLELRTTLEGSLPRLVTTDPTRLQQILFNLVGNAIKFTETGSVAVTARLVTADPAHQKLQFDVADTGIGLTPGQIAGIFEPFTQADASSTRLYGGTGLGLAISQRLAHLLGGEITVSSTPGLGSVFRLEILVGAAAGLAPLDRGETPARCAVLESAAGPAPTGSSPSNHGAPGAPGNPERPSPDLPSATEAAPPQSLAGLRILLAEDGADNRLLVGYVMGKAGAEVEFAENGRLAVDAAWAALRAGEPFDVILMDMQMPVLDGYAATRELRAAGYDLPIVALTAHAMADDRQKCLDAGCDDYGSKPIKRQELLSMLARLARVTLQPV